MGKISADIVCQRIPKMTEHCPVQKKENKF